MEVMPVNCYLRQCEALGYIYGRRRWTDASGRIYTWDSQHGEIEVFNARGLHLGAANAITGVICKPPVKGRTIKV